MRQLRPDHTRVSARRQLGRVLHRWPFARTEPDAGLTRTDRRIAAGVLALIVIVSIAFNATMLFPEVGIRVPSNNDDAFQYLMIQRGAEALADGENPLDNWSPELDLGAPRFLMYQNVPHLAVILLDRALLRMVSLLTLFNVVRYALLIGLPLTVYWSMRRMGFSTVASAFAAAAAPLISADHRFGFEYDSYVWRGYGIYTQLWAMHLTFIATACLYRLANEGKGMALTVAVCALLVLSHLLFAEMMIFTALVIFAAGLSRTNWRARTGRFAAAGALTVIVTAYFWLPFFLSGPYVGVSPYEQSWHFDSFGARTITSWLVHGKLLDAGRWPVLTVLTATGGVVALAGRTRPGLFAVALFVVWLLLYFGRQIWGPVADHLPFGEILLFHRFIAGVQLAAILLIGLGGEAVWRACRIAPRRWGVGLAAIVLLALLVPAMRERTSFYDQNTTWMQQTADAIDNDRDAATILAELRKQPPGRTFAGLREDFGKQLNFGIPFNSVRFSDVLTFERVPAVSPPYQALSLNSDFAWHFDAQNAAHYDVFNVRYVIAPRSWKAPAFLSTITTTRRYTLYRAPTSGYAEFARSTDRRSGGTDKKQFFFSNLAWLQGGDPAAGRFIRWDYPDSSGTAQGPGVPRLPRRRFGDR